MERRIFIETERLCLRQWLTSDEAPFSMLNGSSKVMEFFPSILTPVQSREQMRRLMEDIDKRGYGFFAVERKEDCAFIGFTGISHPRFESYFTPCIEIGWRISEQYWGNGYATEAAKACLVFCAEKKLEPIYSFTSIHNLRSENVMKKIGMVKEGEFDHPSLADGNYLQKHVLYKTNTTSFLL